MGKIAFVATVYRHLEAFHLPCMNMLREQGHEVHACARPDHGRNGIVEQKITCHDISFDRNPYHFRNFRALLQLFKRFRREQFQLVHVHTPVAGILGRIAAKLAGVPCVIYTAHGFHFYQGSPWASWLLYYPLERLLARWTDDLIVMNQEDYENAKSFRIRRQLLHMPGVGVDVSRFMTDNPEQVRIQQRKRLGVGEKDFVILHVAELNRNKNQMQMLQAMKRLAPRHDCIKCIFVGDGEHREFLLAAVQQLGLQDSVQVLGFRRDIPELLAGSDLAVLLSRREGLPQSLLEAMVCGRPILASDVRGNRDLVSHGENGLLVPLDDAEETARAIGFLLENRVLARQMGERGKQMVKPFELPSILERMRAVYECGLMRK